MSEENEIVVLENFEKLPKEPGNHEGKHHHNGREVECKPGTGAITMHPIQIGHEKYFNRTERYVRSADCDEKGRAIFRLEQVGG